MVHLEWSDAEISDATNHCCDGGTEAMRGLSQDIIKVDYHQKTFSDFECGMFRDGVKKHIRSSYYAAG